MSEKDIVNLRNTAQNVGLAENLDIIGESGELEDILRVASNFSQGRDLELPVSNAEIGSIHMKYSSLAWDVMEYANTLIEKYIEEPLDLFLPTMELLNLLPEENKRNYIKSIGNLIERDIEGNCRQYVMPVIINKFLPKLKEKYESQKKLLRKGEGAEKLMADIDKVIKYSTTKLDQNDRYSAEANQISYDECLKEEGPDYKAATPGEIVRAMNNDIAHEDLDGKSPAQYIVAKFGAPIGFAIRGSRHKDENTAVIYFGNDMDQHRVVVDHPQGIETHHAKFYLGLTELATPISALQTNTGKFINHLAHAR